MVAIYHIARHFEANSGQFPFGRITEVGHIGVDFFFTLSGFIILHAHYNDIGKPDKIIRFFKKRIIRIFPIYWVILALNIIVILLFRDTFPSFSTLLQNILLWPSDTYQLIIGVAWTLRHEMLFYGLFSILLLSRHLGLAFLWLWLALILVKFSGYEVSFPSEVSLLVSPFNLQFFLGMLAVLLTRNTAPGKPFALMIILAGLTLLCGTAALELDGTLNGFGKYARLIYGLSFAVLIMGSAWYEKQTGENREKGRNIMGNVSYPMYLFHLLVNGITYKLLIVTGLLQELPMALSATICIVAAFVVPAILAIKLEQPLLAFLKKRWLT